MKTILLIDCGSNKVAALEQQLDQVNISYTTINLNNINPLEVSGYEGVIISGSPILLTEPESRSYSDRFKFLREISIPVLGICFGHQILGLLFKSDIWLHHEIKGEDKLSIDISSPLFSGLNTSEMFDKDHKESISLPEGFIRTAYSERVETEAVQHKSLPLYGVQFHPETSGKAGRQLLKNFIQIVAGS